MIRGDKDFAACVAKYEVGDYAPVVVSHFWDERKLVGNWYSSDVLHRQRTTWDFYALYGPGATWGSEPSRAVSQGGTIITRHEQLEAAISPLLHSGT